MVSDVGDAASSGEQLPVGQVAVGHHARGIEVVTLRGEHDLSTQPRVADALGLAAAHSNVVVDLSECSFIDSTIVQEFIRTREKGRSKGEQVMLVIPPEQVSVARIAEMIGLAQFFELHETTESAFARLEETARDGEPDS